MDLIRIEPLPRVRMALKNLVSHMLPIPLDDAAAAGQPTLRAQPPVPQHQGRLRGCFNNLLAVPLIACQPARCLLMIPF